MDLTNEKVRIVTVNNQVFFGLVKNQMNDYIVIQDDTPTPKVFTSGMIRDIRKASSDT